MELKVYISGKITGEDPLECKIKFLSMETRLKNLGVPVVINPKNMGIPDSWSWDKAMELCMTVLRDKANCVVLLDDWMSSRGSKDEYKYAAEHEYIIIFEHEVDQIMEIAKMQHKWIDTSDIEFP